MWPVRCTSLVSDSYSQLEASSGSQGLAWLYPVQMANKGPACSYWLRTRYFCRSSTRCQTRDRYAQEESPALACSYWPLFHRIAWGLCASLYLPCWVVRPETGGCLPGFSLWLFLRLVLSKGDVWEELAAIQRYPAISFFLLLELCAVLNILR